MRPLLADYPRLQAAKDLVIFAPYGEFNAVARYDQQRVVLTYGMCDQLWLLLRAISLGAIYQRGNADLQRYMEYLSGLTLQIEQNAKRGQWSENEVLPFELFARLDPKKMTDAERYALDKTVEEAMPTAWAQVLGHEIAHLALGHKPYTALSPAQSRAQETTADTFGYRLAAQVITDRMDPSFILPVLVLLSREFAGTPNAVRLHPMPYCRFGRIMLDAGVLDAFEANSELRAQYRERTGRSIAETRRELRTMLREPECQ